MRTKILVAAFAVLLGACSHDVKVTKFDTTAGGNIGGNDRLDVAAQTCDAQAAPDRAGYLSAVQNLIARAGDGGAATAASRASLDRFREEINAAHLMVVMRCKSHMQCLEYNGYDEARCYMADSARRDAEREFRQLAFSLRDLERQVSLAEIDSAKSKARASKPGPRINVETNVTQNNEQTQKTGVGDVIEDQDVLVTCGVEGLLSTRCRQPCKGAACR